MKCVFVSFTYNFKSISKIFITRPRAIQFIFLNVMGRNIIGVSVQYSETVNVINL